MVDLGSLDTVSLGAIFAVCAAIIAVFGSKMAFYADIIADRTGLGEALIGSVLLGAGTSIAGIVTSIGTAADGAPDLAVSNALGGIAAQTMFLALADLFYRRINLEHAAPSLVNIAQACILILLLGIVLVAASGPPLAIWGVHPATILLVGVYLAGLHNARRVHQEPMWLARKTEATRDEADDQAQDDRSLPIIIALFAVLVAIVGLAGWVVGQTGIALSERTGISTSVIGALGTAVITSLPELVTTVAAVRRGALQLAIGGIIGGNMFDALFIAASDIGYLEGSIYHAISPRSSFWVGVVIVMTAILLMGLVRRQKRGPAAIGWGSTLLIGIWIAAAILQAQLG